MISFIKNKKSKSLFQNYKGSEYNFISYLLQFSLFISNSQFYTKTLYITYTIINNLIVSTITVIFLLSPNVMI